VVRVRQTAQAERPRRGRRVWTAPIVFVCIVLVATAAASSAEATVAGFPTEPQEPTIVYAEDFEHEVGITPVLLTKYTGAPPLSARYTAARNYLEHCNGNIVEFKAAPRSASNCDESAFDHVRQMAYALGILRKESKANAELNHAVTAFTDPGELKANEVPFETVTPIPVAAQGRFITFSVDAAETSCVKKNYAKLKFYLLNGHEEIPTFSKPIEPCVEPSREEVKAPKVGETGETAYFVGTFAGNVATLFTGTALGIKMVNGQGETTGNDAAFDNIRVLDATPQLDKSFSPAVVTVGARSQLTFTITNTRDLAAKSGWSFTDRLPTGLKLATPSAPATTCPQPTSVTALDGTASIEVKGTLAAGMNYCLVTVDVTSAIEGTYTNDSSNITERGGIDPPGPATVTFADNADLGIEKTASPSPAAPDSDVTYTLTVINHGPDAAREASVSDQLPAGLSFVSASNGCRPESPTQHVAGHPGLTPGPLVACQLGELRDGAKVVITLVAHIASDVSEGFVNVATVQSPTPDPDHSNNAAAASTPLPPEADLELSKAASLATVSAGGQVQYTLTVKNNGPSEATNVVAADPLPAQLAAVSAQPSQGSCSIAHGVVCQLGTIDVGASAQIVVTAETAASSTGKVTNTAVVAGGQTDPNPQNNSASATIEVIPVTPDPLPVPPAPPLPPAPPVPASEVLSSLTELVAPEQLISDLQIAKSVNHRHARPHQRLTYTLDITNHGPDEAPDVRVSDSSSLALHVLAIHPSQGSCRLTQPLVCVLGKLPRDGRATIRILAEPTASGAERNTATVSSSNRDPDLQNNQSSARTEIAAPLPILTG
jgi:uncharacterized repeat protein (TIGR01451 family)